MIQLAVVPGEPVSPDSSWLDLEDDEVKPRDAVTSEVSQTVVSTSNKVFSHFVTLKLCALLGKPQSQPPAPLASLLKKTIVTAERQKKLETEEHNKAVAMRFAAHKRKAILDCLAGDESGQVNLWALRELSLSQGGLLEPELRKRAWPKLLACHEQLLLNEPRDPVLSPSRRQRSQNQSQFYDSHVEEAAMTVSPLERCTVRNLPLHRPVVDPNAGSVELLKFDVSRTIWNIEESLRAACDKRCKLQRLHQQEQQQTSSPPRPKRVSFAPAAQVATLHTRAPRPDFRRTSSPSPPHGIPSSPQSDDEVEDDDGVEEEKTLHQKNQHSHLLNGGTHASVQNGSSNFVLSSRVVRWHKSSKAEQKILFNTVMAVLRTQPLPGHHGGTFHYFTGMQDLTALLMINLESPSLTSLVLSRLADTHLRDAMSPMKRPSPHTHHHHHAPIMQPQTQLPLASSSCTTLDCVVNATFMPLLEQVDPTLYRALVYKAGITLPTFSRQWMISWFAQDIPDEKVASRVLDVLLASHPLMSLYISVALLTCNRSYILKNISSDSVSLSKLYTLLRNLPMHTLTVSADGGCKNTQGSKNVHLWTISPLSSSLLSPEERMDRMEYILHKACQYMNAVPPAVLVVLSLKQERRHEALPADLSRTAALLQDPPVWCTASTVPADTWLFSRQYKTSLMQPERRPNPKIFPLACAAAGLGQAHWLRRNVTFALGLLALLFFVVAMLAWIMTAVTPAFVSLDETIYHTTIVATDSLLEPLSFQREDHGSSLQSSSATDADYCFEAEMSAQASKDFAPTSPDKASPSASNNASFTFSVFQDQLDESSIVLIRASSAWPARHAKVSFLGRLKERPSIASIVTNTTELFCPMQQCKIEAMTADNDIRPYVPGLTTADFKHATFQQHSSVVIKNDERSFVEMALPINWSQPNVTFAGRFLEQPRLAQPNLPGDMSSVPANVKVRNFTAMLLNVDIVDKHNRSKFITDFETRQNGAAQEFESSVRVTSPSLTILGTLLRFWKPLSGVWQKLIMGLHNLALALKLAHLVT